MSAGDITKKKIVSPSSKSQCETGNMKASFKSNRRAMVTAFCHLHWRQKDNDISLLERPQYGISCKSFLLGERVDFALFRVIVLSHGVLCSPLAPSVSLKIAAAVVPSSAAPHFKTWQSLRNVEWTPFFCTWDQM